MQITQDQVRIHVSCDTEEPGSLDRAIKDYGPAFGSAVREMRKENRRWGWCQVTVMVKLLKGPVHLRGYAYLGECSYKSRQDFIDNSGYYEDMVKDAIADLQREYNAHCRDLADHLNDLADGQDDDLGQLLTQAASALELTTNVVTATG